MHCEPRRGGRPAAVFRVAVGPLNVVARGVRLKKDAAVRLVAGARGGCEGLGAKRADRPVARVRRRVVGEREAGPLARDLRDEVDRRRASTPFRSAGEGDRGAWCHTVRDALGDDVAAWVKGDLGLFVADGGLPLETELDERPARPAERARQALELGREPATTKRASISSRDGPLFQRCLPDQPRRGGALPRGARARARGRTPGRCRAAGPAPGRGASRRRTRAGSCAAGPGTAAGAR